MLTVVEFVLIILSVYTREKTMKKFLISLIPIKKIRRRLKERYFSSNKEFSLSGVKKCLMVAPHPDDETLAAGGLMIKYADKFDCICMASAGVKTPDIGAEDRADLRIKEFYQVMDTIGIKNRWIFKTFGIPPMCDQIENYFTEYCKVLDTKQYDCIFLPHPKDNHVEHQYITNYLFKRILKQKGFNPNVKIVFYEVWRPLDNPNYYEDISDVVEEKKKILELYVSQWVKYNLIPRIIGLNSYRGFWANNAPYAESFEVITMQKYLAGKTK